MFDQHTKEQELLLTKLLSLKLLTNAEYSLLKEVISTLETELIFSKEKLTIEIDLS
jgi:hypothetical protein